MNDVCHKTFLNPDHGQTSRSIAELERMRLEIDREICEKREAERLRTAERIIRIAKEAGFSLPELADMLPLREDMPVRYRHPDHPDQVWCGKGRRPLWMNQAIDKGITLQQMRAL